MMKKRRSISLLAGLMLPLLLWAVPGDTPEQRYRELQKQLSQGWNTWDTRSVLTHVLLPYGAAVDLNLIDADHKRADTFRIGGYPQLSPGTRTYDGSYTDISVEWNGHKFRVQTAAEGWKNIILVTPLEGSRKGGQLVVVPKSLWLRANNIEVDGNRFTMQPGDSNQRITGEVNGDFRKQEKNEIYLSTDNPVVIACNQPMTVAEATRFMQQKAEAFVTANRQKYGENYELYNAMQNVLAWDNIYDPTIRKVITPVSRSWNVRWSSNPQFGGFVLFCWDTYFASMMFAVDNKELAYANAVEITNALTENGFIPNFYADNDYKSRDRSQPPVGSFALWNLYKQYQDKWLLELLYDKLLTWNRWWDKNRQADGLLCWGSSPFEKVTYRNYESGINGLYAASLESGLDNSPMYDGVPYDRDRHLMQLNDVGLSSLYVMDCNYLQQIARELGHTADARELAARSARYAKNLQGLWDEEQGMFYNRHTDTGKLNPRTSPTNFYPLLAGVPNRKQAGRMMNEHLLNPAEFGGEWMIPATPRNDPAFKDNIYWRGRIWAPLNFLVYAGLYKYDLPQARKEVATKSKALLLKSWLADRYVFENYNSVTGVGDDTPRSDHFYHWGALLSFIGLIEDGYFRIY